MRAHGWSILGAVVFGVAVAGVIITIPSKEGEANPQPQAPWGYCGEGTTYNPRTEFCERQQGTADRPGSAATPGEVVGPEAAIASTEGVDPNPPENAYASEQEAERAWQDAQAAFFAAPGNAGLLASEVQRAAYQAALNAVFQEAKGTISYVEALNRAKARVAPTGGYPDRAEALHRAEVAQTNARASQAAQLEAIYREQQHRQRRAAAEAEYQTRRFAEEQRIQARRAADEASYQARRAEREASYASRSYGTASASNYETAPYRHAVPAAPEPRQFRDYQGNSYTQPSGSNFATDTRTGQQCFVNGDFVHCK